MAGVGQDSGTNVDMLLTTRLKDRRRMKIDTELIRNGLEIINAYITNDEAH